MNNKVKILIADDHPLMRQGIKWALEQNEEFNIIGEAEDGEKAFSLLKHHQPDVVTLDIEMPVMSGFEIARKILEEKIQTKIIFLTMYKDEQMFNEAIDIGAKGYVLKENAIDDIVECVKKVSQGSSYISPALSNFILNKNKNLRDMVESVPSIRSLTKTERKILKLISKNLTSKEIAESLFISIKTVENHRSNISRKLSLHGSHSLIKFALDNKTVL